MINYSIALTIFFIASFSSSSAFAATDDSTQKIVMQLTRGNDNFAHRKSFFQIDKVLSEIGENKLKIVVVAYEDGIHALTQNSSTAQMLTKLSNRGVIFKACKISMKAWDLSEDDFPLEVEFVSAGAPEMIRRQLSGYKYWKP
ncbi:MAG: DsrE family protein [Gammaproteobacteria bacterium]|nr:DsrE family protein [Gammaproteobacteria bacterium]